MGGASSKAARTLPKSTSLAGSSSTPLRGSGGIPPSARPPPGGGTASRPSPSQASGSSSTRPDLSSYQTADAIGQQGRQASPIAGRGSTGRPGQVGPIVERSEGGSERKTDTIRRDAFDPDFVSQLNSLGPVSVPQRPWSDDNTATSSTSPAASRATQQAGRGQSQMLRILQARQEREDAAAGNPSGSSSSTADAATTSSGTDQRHLDASTLVLLLDELKSAKSQKDIDHICHSYDFDIATLKTLTKRFNSPSIGGRVDPEDAKWDEDRDSDRPPRMYAVWTEPDLSVAQLGSGQQAK